MKKATGAEIICIRLLHNETTLINKTPQAVYDDVVEMLICQQIQDLVRRRLLVCNQHLRYDGT
jgi:hypothetical protein